MYCQDSVSTKSSEGGGGGNDLLSAIRNFGGAAGGLKSVSHVNMLSLIQLLFLSHKFVIHHQNNQIIPC